MTSRANLMVGAMALIVLSLAACTATLIRPGSYQGEYEKPVEVVKKAGIDAVVNDFEITQNKQ